MSATVTDSASDANMEELAAFYRERRRGLLRYIRSIFGFLAVDEVEDILQDAFLNATTRAGAFDSARGRLEPWLFQIIRNAAIDHVRRRGTRKKVVALSLDDKNEEVSGGFASGAPSPLSNAILAEMVERLEAHLAGLSPTVAEVVRLHVFDGQASTVTAQQLGIPEGTARAYLFHQRRALAPLLT